MTERIWQGALILVALALVAASSRIDFTEQECRRAVLVSRNAALELAADYLNALGPDRTLTAFEAARAVRALKDGMLTMDCPMGATIVDNFGNRTCLHEEEEEKP